MGAIPVALIPVVISLVQQYGPEIVHGIMSIGKEQTCPTLEEIQGLGVQLKTKGADYFANPPAA